MTNTPKKLELLVVPVMARIAIVLGWLSHAWYLNKSDGTKCKAPYTGNIHLKTCCNLSSMAI